MARVIFTTNLSHHTALTEANAPGRTVAEVMARIFTDHPLARGYILNDQGAVRKHVAIFVNTCAIQDRNRLSDAVTDSCEICIMQALSGG